MRARDLIEKRSPAARKLIALRLGADSAEPSALLTAMQSPRVARALEKLCTSAVMWEDLVLLSANPYDVVAEGELVAPALFEESGLIEPCEGGWEVNLDLALAFAPSVPLEFGYAATLLARLDTVALARVARAMEIGPRPSPIDYVLDIAEACTDPTRIQRQLAHLRSADRQPLREALALGELPDGIEQLSADTRPPVVTVDTSEAGSRGLLFRIAQPERGIAERAVVPLETLDRLGDLMDRVKPPPDVVAAPAPRKRSTTSTTRPKPVAVAAPPEPLLAQTPVPTPSWMPDVTPLPGFGPASSGGLRKTPDARASGSGPGRALRAAHVRACVGVVDLESPRLAEAARKDPELGPSVLAVVAGNLVVLHEGVDLRDWVERAAARVGFG